MKRLWTTLTRSSAAFTGHSERYVRGVIAAGIRARANDYATQGRVDTDWLTVAHMLRGLADSIENPRAEEAS